MLRTAWSLPPTGLSTLRFDAGRFPPTPAVCYRASWQLPGPDSHRQATTSTPKDQLTISSEPPSASGRTPSSAELRFFGSDRDGHALRRRGQESTSSVRPSTRSNSASLSRRQSRPSSPEMRNKSSGVGNRHGRSVHRCCGGGGIRTHEAAEPPTGFQDRRLQPDSATPPRAPV